MHSSATKSKINATPFGVIVVTSALSCFGCGAYDAPATTPTTASDSELLICNTPKDGGPLEYYVLPAIAAKLDYYPEFASEIGIQSVSDCQGARTYMQAYRAYSTAHPGFDADQPIGDLFATPSLPEGPSPTLQMPKLLNGPDLYPSGYPTNPVVRLTATFVFDQILTFTAKCSGTFIAKNWITTAAHCLAVVTDSNFTPVTSPDFPFQTVPLPGDKWPAARLWGWAKWTIEFADEGGNPSVDLRATLNSGTDDVLQYPDPRYQGGGALDTNDDIPNDFALLYLDKDRYDRLLPPRADTGAAMRVAVRAPTTTDELTMAGYGGGSTPALTTGALPDDDQRHIVDATFSADVNDPNEPVLCEGDSGGPLYRMVNAGLLNAPDMEPVLIATAVAFAGPGVMHNGFRCATQGATEIWRRADTELDFIEKAMRIWNGENFSCDQKQVAGGLALDFAECWGAPCGGPTGQTCGTDATQFCSRPGEVLDTEADCPTCSGDGTCGCVVGQCLPSPPASILLANSTPPDSGP
jgi:hypothetical protein